MNLHSYTKAGAALLAVLAFVACNHSQNENDGIAHSAIEKDLEIPMADSANAYLPQPQNLAQFKRSVSFQSQSKQLLPHALQIEALTQKLGGYVAKSAQQTHVQSGHSSQFSPDSIQVTEQYTLESDMLLKIPNARLDSFLLQIQPYLGTIAQREQHTTHVQLQLLQQNMRIRQQMDAEKRLNQPGEKEKAADRLALYQARLQQGQSEAILKALEIKESVAFAEVSIQMQQPALVRQTTIAAMPAQKEAWQPSFLYKLGQALAHGKNGFMAVVLVLCSLWPLWMVVGAAYYLYKTLRRPGAFVRAVSKA